MKPRIWWSPAEPGNSVYHHWLGRAYGRRADPRGVDDHDDDRVLLDVLIGAIYARLRESPHPLDPDHVLALVGLAATWVPANSATSASNTTRIGGTATAVHYSVPISAVIVGLLVLALPALAPLAGALLITLSGTLLSRTVAGWEPRKNGVAVMRPVAAVCESTEKISIALIGGPLALVPLALAGLAALLLEKNPDLTPQQLEAIIKATSSRTRTRPGCWCTPIPSAASRANWRRRGPTTPRTPPY